MYNLEVEEFNVAYRITSKKNQWVNSGKRVISQASYIYTFLLFEILNSFNRLHS
jgi:hypothetical protein